MESIRIGQCSVMLRSVMQEVEIDDGTTRYKLPPGVTVATMLALTNTTSAPGLDRYDPDRWDGRRLRDERDLPAKEAVTTFGFGSHRCPAQRFSLSAITRTVARLAARYDLTAEFGAVRPMPEQIGGVGRAADPCPITYRARNA
jgi:cytochrome P450